MPGRSTQEWIRLSLRTPGILIFGMVLSPCGWILNLTATVAPSWRTLHEIPNFPPNEFISQGIWEICRATTTNTRQDCSLSDTTYFSNQIIQPAQGLMVASLVVTLIGLAVAIPGVRCWKERPNWVVAGLGGILIFLSGVMTIIPIAWYTHFLDDIATVTPVVAVRVGYCIILGYIGGIFEVLAGFVMFIGICRCCGGKNRGERRLEEVTATRFNQPKPAPRRLEVPSLNRARSNASSSVPYSKDSLDEDVSFPRAKSPAARSANTSYNDKEGIIEEKEHVIMLLKYEKEELARENQNLISDIEGLRRVYAESPHVQPDTTSPPASTSPAHDWQQPDTPEQAENLYETIGSAADTEEEALVCRHCQESFPCITQHELEQHEQSHRVCPFCTMICDSMDQSVFEDHVYGHEL